MIRFDPYAVAPPRVAGWEYVVDDEPIRRAGALEPRLLAEGHGAVRLAPDCAFRAWRNEHVLVFEDGWPPTLRVRASLWLGRRDLGADILDFEARIEDADGECRPVLMVPARQLFWAGVKVGKVIDWYRSERARRDLGQPRMLTSLELWMGEHARATAS